MIKYVIYDKASLNILKEKEGFSTKKDAQIQAEMDAKVENIKNFDIFVFDTDEYNAEFDPDLAYQVFVD